MKRLILLLPLLFLGACDVASVEKLDKEAVAPDVYTYTDPETKVQYLLYQTDRGGGITVRLNEDGTPYLKEEK